MVLSRHIEKLIDKYYPRIISDVPLTEILFDLRADQVLTDEEVYTLKDRYHSHKEKIFQFIVILKSRGDEDFHKFCRILQDYEAEYIRNFGKLLLDESSKLQIYFMSINKSKAGSDVMLSCD